MTKGTMYLLLWILGPITIRNLMIRKNRCFLLTRMPTSKANIMETWDNFGNLKNMEFDSILGSVLVDGLNRNISLMLVAHMMLVSHLLMSVLQYYIAFLDYSIALICTIILDARDWEHISPPGFQFGEVGNITRPDDGTIQIFTKGTNFGLFLSLLRQRLNESGFNYVTITACVTGDQTMMSALPLSVMATVLDSINIMTYDFASSSWGPCNASHHTNLFATSLCSRSVDTAVKAYLKAGVPANKLVIGAVLYSRGFANTDGLGCPSSGLVNDKSWEEGVCDTKSLPRPGATEYFDYEAQAHYSYDSQKRILNSYDSVQSVQAKCKYVRDMNLKGIIVWESSGDFPIDHPRSVIRALFEGLSR